MAFDLWDWLRVPLFGILSALALLQTSPWVVKTPGNDSGIFLYFGQEILRGRLPFVDLWDHKPPLVFYLNALGLLLGGGSRWGVWALQVAALLVACLLAYACLRRYFGAWAGLLAVLGMLANLGFVLEGGNLTEEYALAFQFAALYLFTRCDNGLDGMPFRRSRIDWRIVAAGVAVGCAFLLKQTLIGVGLAITIYLIASALFAERRSPELRSMERSSAAAPRALLLLAQMLAGFAAVVLASMVYFALRGGLAAYWDVAFWYNFVYSGSGVAAIDRLASALDVLKFLNTRSGFFLLAAMAWLAGWAYVLLHHRPARRYATRRWTGLLWLAGGLLFLGNGLLVKPWQFYALSAISPYRWGLIAIGLLLLLVCLLVLSGWMERRVYLWLEARSTAGPDAPALLPVYLALLDLPINIAFIALPGRGYQHYYLALFPSLTILIAFLAWGVGSQGLQRGRTAARGMPAVWSAVLLIPVAFGGAAFTLEKIHPGADLQTSLTVQYIREHTLPGDTILMWGTQTGIYYLSGRESPTRYVHQIPLFNPRYATPQRVQEYLSDITNRKPALIIDTRLRSMPLVYHAGDSALCSQPAPADTAEPGSIDMTTVYAYICANYVQDTKLGPDGWIVYRYAPFTKH